MNRVEDFLPAGDEKNEQNGAVEPPEAKKLSELVLRGEDDPQELLRRGYLCRGGGLLLVGPTGIGKSSLAMQFKLAWGLGLPLFGITPTRALTSLLIQAENDEGDLAEMRDGVIAGMGLSKAQRDEAQSRILVCREDTRAGFRFFAETIQPLVARHKPDLLWIDPALAYLAGEVGSQKDVGGFLRNMLNPILREFSCGCVTVHHTNKPPTGREKPDWNGADFAYLGSGSAEWANWARAVLALRSLGQQGIFELRAGKRGGRLGWRAEDGSPKYERTIGHTPGTICWREVDAGEVTAPGRPKGTTADEALALLPRAGLTVGEWLEAVASETGASRTTFYRLKTELERTGRIAKSSTSGQWQPVFKKP